MIRVAPTIGRNHYRYFSSFPRPIVGAAQLQEVEGVSPRTACTPRESETVFPFRQNDIHRAQVKKCGFYARMTHGNGGRVK
jgi:hypothetical protein